MRTFEELFPEIEGALIAEISGNKRELEKAMQHLYAIEDILLATPAPRKTVGGTDSIAVGSLYAAWGLVSARIRDFVIGEVLAHNGRTEAHISGLHLGDANVASSWDRAEINIKLTIKFKPKQ